MLFTYGLQPPSTLQSLSHHHDNYPYQWTWYFQNVWTANHNTSHQFPLHVTNATAKALLKRSCTGHSHLEFRDTTTILPQVHTQITCISTQFETYSVDSTRKITTKYINWFCMISLPVWCLTLWCYYSVQQLRNLSCIDISSIVGLLGWLEVKHNSVTVYRVKYQWYAGTSCTTQLCLQQWT